MARSPELSVVVVVLAGPRALARCLSALEGQTRSAAPEVVVPHDETLTSVSELRSRFTRVRFEAAEGRRSYAELRALGFRRAKGRVVAVTEDHCAPDPDWCDRLLAHHADGHDVVGGRVERAVGEGVGASSRLDWAIYLTDFHRYMGPVDAGSTLYLTDCNVSYRREALEGIAALWERAFHETTVNWALHDDGRSLHLAEDVVVRQHRHLSPGYALHERFAFGRLFASTRASRIGRGARLAYAAASALLPALLTARVVRAVLGKRRHVRRLISCLPHLTLANTVWAAGELVGYCTARSGTLPLPPDLGGRDDARDHDGAAGARERA